MEKESNQVQLQPLWPYQCLPSFHTTVQGELSLSVDCNMEDTLFYEIDMIEPTIVTNEKETFSDILKDLKDDDFLDSLTVKNWETFNYDDPKANDDLNFGIEHSYEQSIYLLYPTSQRIQPQDTLKDLKGDDFMDSLTVKNWEHFHCFEYDDPKTNAPVNLNYGPEHSNEHGLYPTSQRIQHEMRPPDFPNYCESYDKHNRKTTEKNDDDDDVSGSNNKEIFQIVNSQECDNESIHSSENESGILNILNAINSPIKTKHEDYKRIHKDDRLHVCVNCNKSFKNISNLNMHSIIHTGEKPHTCGICNKSFWQKSNLLAHAKIHTDDRPCVCRTCNKSFRTDIQLKAHSYIHTGERPHTCGICNKQFRQKANLSRHSQIHSDEKPYPCGICGKSFRQRSNLLSHLRIHTGEKPFACYVCEKEFTQQRYLLYHSRIHTGEKPYKCKVCPVSYTRKDVLMKHSKTHLR